MKTELSHIPYLDGWRGIAIILVLIGHTFDAPGSRLGVEVFFVLSGMLMARVLFDAQVPLGTFYWRRCVRILPTFFLFLSTMVALAATMAPPFASKQFLFNVLFIASYLPSDAPLSVLHIQHLWSLNVEEHSYVFLSLVALFSRQNHIARAALVAAAGACVVNYVMYGAGDATSIFRSEYAAFPLLASAALHLWLRRFSKARLLLTIGTVGFAASVLASRKYGSSVEIDYILKPLCLAIMLNTLQAAPSLVLRALSARWLRWMGVCSFSIYLWHPPILEWARIAEVPRLAALAIALAVGAMSFYFFENPVRKTMRLGPLGIRKQQKITTAP